MERLGDGIGRELARTGSRDAVPLAALTAAWPAAVGATVARRAWPLRLARNGTLHVAAASSTWAHELDLLQGEVLEGLRRELGDAAPAAVRFAVGPLPEPPGTSEGAPDRAPIAYCEVPPEVEREASSAASEIDDPELRELAARAARASLLKARAGR